MLLPSTERRLALAFLTAALSAMTLITMDTEARADEPTRESVKREFFENRIRPTLVGSCYECHNSVTAQEGGLALDHRAALLAGGDSGTVVVPGKPGESRLLSTLRHEIPGVEMPQGDAKLSDRTIADFERWIADGAFDPRDAPPTLELADATAWETLFAKRKDSWRYRPPVESPEPVVVNDAWPVETIDRFLLAKMEEAGLAPAEEADRRTLLRRLSFVATGLPPTREEIAAFLADESPDAYERQVDRLLESDRFGEAWARHWMDWLRYAETHGSEGDPTIPFAWRFRDYLIRSLNDEVPVDRLIAELVAGDLLDDPRIDEATGVNQSKIGPAQFRFVQHGFAPTDALDEKVRFTDNQIDVLSKAFLGLTVSCARCHDHKFDAVSQADYYALFGIAANCRPATVTVDSPDRGREVREELASIKAEIRQALATDWRRAVDDVPATPADVDDSPAWKAAFGAADQPTEPLYVWGRLKDLRDEAFAAEWKSLADDVALSRERIERRFAIQDDADRSTGWSLSEERDVSEWIRHGSGSAKDLPASAGEFSIATSGDRAVDGPYPAGVYSHLLSDKASGVVSSPRFDFDRKYVYLRVLGDGDARARYVVQNYPRRGTVYPIESLKGGELRWIRWDVNYWAGDDGYLEITTAADQPVEGDPSRERSWFGVLEARLLDEDDVAAGEALRDEIAEFVGPLFAHDETPKNAKQLRERYRDALRDCIDAFADESMSNEQALFLRAFVRDGRLPADLDRLPTARSLIERYRDVEADLPIPTRAPGVLEGESRDQRLLVRGNHKDPTELVERRFLSAIDPTPYEALGSGRRELARSLVDPKNPLTARVFVNRVWRHVFGRGIVATPDNFGVLGEAPTHPELLDTLASRFVRDGWSTKRLVREMLLSRAFRQSALPSDAATRLDPDNRLLSHASVRRLEAEAIRDSLLAVAGDLDPTPFGPPTNETSARRSVYVAQRRTDMPPLLAAFDAPAPFSTVGRRDVTNVPAQSLALLNDPFVADLARSWAERAIPDPHGLSERDRSAAVDAMFETAFGRPPDSNEREAALAYVASSEEAHANAVARARELTREAKELRASRTALIEPVRSRLLGEASASKDEASSKLHPIVAWNFDGDARDAVGSLHATLHGQARIVDGALSLDGASYAEAGPVPTALGAKTLEAWVVLEGLDQRGGGALSVQSADGARFDAIVFGERDPRRWMAGSEFFRRTQPFDGPDETEADRRPVHVAVVYADDGTVAAYRDGSPYGTPYRSTEPLAFEANEATILFGLRHSPPGGNKFLRGSILAASLFDRALTGEEVALAAKATPAFVDEASVLAAMTEDDRRAVAEVDGRLRRAELELASIPERDRDPDPRKAWSDLALAFFNFKEFVYVR